MAYALYIFIIFDYHLESARLSRDSWYRPLHGLVVLGALPAHPLPPLLLHH